MGDVVEEQARERERLHVVDGRDFFPRLAVALKRRVAGLERPHDERAEAARLVLETPDARHARDALLHGLAEADDHRRRALHADFVRRAHDVEVVVGRNLLRAHAAPHGVVEDFRAAAWQAREARILQAQQRLADGETRFPCEMLDFRRRERMDDELRKFALDSTQHIEVVVEAEPRIKPALNHDLRATRLGRLAAFREDFVRREQIGARVVLLAVERAETAFVLADVRIVDVAVDQERRSIAIAFAADGIRRTAEGEDVAVL